MSSQTVASFYIDLEQFSGPLDLLCYLIKSQELNILDVSILTICEQYLKYLSLFEQLNINQAAEYLSMAAELIRLKMDILCHRTVPTTSVDPEESQEESLFRQKLMDYDTMQMTASLLLSQWSCHETFPVSVLPGHPSDDLPRPLGPHDVYDLALSWEQVLHSCLERERLQWVVEKEQYYFDGSRIEILKWLRESNSFHMVILLRQFGSLEKYVFGFMTLLEMVRTGDIELIDNQDEIVVKLLATS